MYWKVSSKNKLLFLVKLSTENSSFRVNIFYFDVLQLPIIISNEINESVKCSQIRFLIKRFPDFFLFKLLLVKSWFMFFTAFFVFYGTPKMPSVWCKIFLIWCKKFDVSCKIFLIFWEKTRFGVKVLLFGVKFLVLRVVFSEYGVTFLK